MVVNHANFRRRQRPGRKGMYSLPPGVHRRRTTTLLWSEYGLTDRLQFGLAVPYVFRTFQDREAGIDDRGQGIGDVWLYGKYRIVSERQIRPAISTDVWLKTCTGKRDRGLGNGKLDVRLTAEISKRIQDFSFHLNPGYTFTGGSHSKIGKAAWF